jgi:hypothetical protein
MNPENHNLEINWSSEHEPKPGEDTYYLRLLYLNTAEGYAREYQNYKKQFQYREIGRKILVLAPLITAAEIITQHRDSMNFNEKFFMASGAILVAASFNALSKITGELKKQKTYELAKKASLIYDCLNLSRPSWVDEALEHSAGYKSYSNEFDYDDDEHV